MTDRELLELAAKAAGLDVRGYSEPFGIELPLCKWWNPLTDDGDALRLAVKLQLMVKPEANCAKVYRGSKPKLGWITEEGGDVLAATRRAIARAAAALSGVHKVEP